jgi:hypothetical protein
VEYWFDCGIAALNAVVIWGFAGISVFAEVALPGVVWGVNDVLWLRWAGAVMDFPTVGAVVDHSCVVITPRLRTEFTKV